MEPIIFQGANLVGLVAAVWYLRGRLEGLVGQVDRVESRLNGQLQLDRELTEVRVRFEECQRAHATGDCSMKEEKGGAPGQQSSSQAANSS